MRIIKFQEKSLPHLRHISGVFFTFISAESMANRNPLGAPTTLDQRLFKLFISGD